MLLDPSTLLEYILGLQILESTVKKTKEIFQWSIIVESRMMKQGSFPITQLVLPISYNLPTQSSLRSFHWIQPLNMAWGASKSAWVTCSRGQHLYWLLQSQLPWPLSIVLPDSWPFSSALNSPFFPGTLIILPSREWLTIYLYYKWLLTNL